MDKLLKIMNYPLNQEWQRNQSRCEVKYINGMKSHRYLYSARDGSFGISSRDCYEKVINFEHDGIVYKYSSSLKDDSYPE